MSGAPWPGGGGHGPAAPPDQTGFPIGDETQANAGFRGRRGGDACPGFPSLQPGDQTAASGRCLLLPRLTARMRAQAVPLFCTLPPTSGNRATAQPPPLQQAKRKASDSPVQCDCRREERQPRALGRDRGHGQAALGLCICPNKTRECLGDRQANPKIQMENNIISG